MSQSSRDSKKSISDYVHVIIPEFLGTALLLFVAGLGSTTGELLQQCLVNGLAVLTAMQIFSHMSGAYINPAITLAAYISGQIPPGSIIFYVVSELLGSIAGFALFRIILPSHLYKERVGMTLPQIGNITEMHIFAIEFIISLILVFANCACWDYRTRRLYDSVALKIGFIVAVLNCIAAPYTGCSMNPARSFGPAVWYNNWLYQWIYWAAPLSAAIVGSVIYKFVLLPKISPLERQRSIMKENSSREPSVV